jgi:hypothetical protein
MSLLGRRKDKGQVPAPDEERQVLTDLMVELRDGLERTKRLMGSYERGGLSTDEREEARRGARQLAVEGRIGFINIDTFPERAPELWSLYAPGLRAAGRLSYCLLALAGDEPEPTALISPNELETVLDEEDSEGELGRFVAAIPDSYQREH